MGRASFRAVTLDAAGTLLEAKPDPATVYAAALSRHGRRVAAADVAPLFREVWHELDALLPLGTDRYHALPGGERGWWASFLQTLLRRLGHDAPAATLLDELWHHFEQPGAWCVYPEVPAALAALRRHGCALAVVSNWDSRLPVLLKRLGLADAFDAVVVSALEGVEKPDPEIFGRALARLGVAPGHALHAGDSPRDDCDGALAAGLDAVLVDRWGRHAGACRHRVPDLEALAQLVTGGRATMGPDATPKAD